MTRLVPGKRDYDDGIARPLPHCTGSCHGGRAPCNCPTGLTELANGVPLREQLVRSIPSRPPIQISGGRVPRTRRVRRFLRALWDFLTAPCFKP
jgi:hypothetical protein